MNNVNRRRYVIDLKSLINISIILFLIIFSFFLFFYKNYIFITSKNIIHTFSENFQYQLKTLDISGLDRIESKYLEDKLEKYIKSSIFLLPLDQISRSIKENNWIKEIYLKTNYKDTLFIKVIEYKPIGIYYFNKKYFFFEKNGKIIDEILAKDLSDKSLIVFKGNSSNLKAYKLINILLNNNFQKKYKIDFLEYVNKRRWDITLQHNIKLMLSEEDPNKSIQNFITIQNKLSEIDMNNIKVYDLRDLNKTILSEKYD